VLTTYAGEMATSLREDPRHTPKTKGEGPKAAGSRVWEEGALGHGGEDAKEDARDRLQSWWGKARVCRPAPGHGSLWPAGGRAACPSPGRRHPQCPLLSAPEHLATNLPGSPNTITKMPAPLCGAQSDCFTRILWN
jgi:hypothetical protein